DLAPLGRDRGHHHRRHRGRDECAADQDRLAVALRPRREVQPAAAHRGRPRRFGELPRPGSLSQARMKTLAAALAALILLIQIPLWFGKGGWFRAWQLEEVVFKEKEKNMQLERRNSGLAAEVKDLKTGSDAVEERARYELGLVRKDEVFVQIVDEKPKSAKP